MSVDYTIGIDINHNALHRGKRFTSCYTKALSAGSVLTVAITTPAAAAGYVHLAAQVDYNLSGIWYFTTGASTSVGSALTVYNNNLNSTATSGAAIVGTPTVTTYGTAIETHVVGSNTGSQNIREGYILVPATQYMIYFLANATSTYSAITLAFDVD